MSNALASKETLRVRLQWVISSRPSANPSRATLKCINDFFMSHRQWPSGFPRYKRNIGSSEIGIHPWQLLCSQMDLCKRHWGFHKRDLSVLLYVSNRLHLLIDCHGIETRNKQNRIKRREALTLPGIILSNWTLPMVALPYSSAWLGLNLFPIAFGDLLILWCYAISIWFSAHRVNQTSISIGH